MKLKLWVIWAVIWGGIFSSTTLCWGQIVLFNRKINSDISVDFHNEQQIMINPTNPNNVVAIWRDFRLGYRQVGIGYSTSGGETWTDKLIGFQINPFEWESDPGLTVDRWGNFYAVTLCLNEAAPTSGICIYKSADGGVSWAGPIIVDSGQAFEDKELMTCDRTGGDYDGNLYISWTRFSANYPGVPIFFTASSTGGVSWSAPKQLSADSVGTQWSVPVVGFNGEVYVAWSQYGFPAHIVFTKSSDGGNNFSAPEEVFPVSEEFFVLKGDIQVFSYPALACDISNSPHRGNLYVAFMDKSSLGDEDIFFSYSTDQGDTWSSLFRINDDPIDDGVDQFHPWICVNQDGVISIIFYDRRNDPDNLLFDVYMTQSYDGGKTFTANKRITTVSSYPLVLLSNSLSYYSGEVHTAYYSNQPLVVSPLGGLLGEYIGISSYGSQNNLIWTDTREGHQNIYTAKVITKLLIPKPLSPANLSHVPDNTPSFSWTGFSFYDTVSYYKLQYALDKNFSSGVQTIDSLTDTTLALPQNLALAETTYYWRVQGFNSQGDSSGYPDLAFIFTVDVTTPLVPLIISPVDTSGDLTPLFSWGSVTSLRLPHIFQPVLASPVRYLWQLAQDTSFTLNLISISDLAHNHYQLPDSQALDTGQTYFWRVRAYDLAGNQSAFTPTIPFQVWGYLPGDANADKKILLSDVVYIINYIFKNGPVPKINILSGDANCNNKVNLVDAVFLINFLFKNGPSPCS